MTLAEIRDKIKRKEYIKRGLSVLINGETRDNKPLHVVLGIAQEEPVVITVYAPTPPKWKSPTVRGGSKP